MIVEFFGLPGAGKTSLESALLEALAPRGLSIVSRDEAVSELIDAWSGIRRDPPSLLSRGSSAFYRWRLVRDALTARPPLLDLSALRHPHLVRAARRVAENARLYPWLRKPASGNRIAILCEGIIQHLIAYTAWRELLGARDATPDLGALLRPLLQSDSMLVHVDLPVADAQQRLLARGAPPLWPNTPIEQVEAAFLAATDAVMQALPDGSQHKLIHIDAATVGRDWRRPAEALAQTICED